MNILPAFWSWWVIGITLISLAFLVWLVFDVYFITGKKEVDADVKWDEDLQEGRNRPPMWWFWFIFVFILFTFLYLIIYPGLGNYKGLLNWSSAQSYAENLVLFDYQHKQQQDTLAQSSLQELQQNPQVMKLAVRLYQQNCAACHGADAQGQANAFPNLLDERWLWGNTPEAITHSITQGRVAVMPAWQGTLQEDEIEKVTDYVQSLASGEAQAQTKHPIGATKFKQFCIACHGAEGKGTSLLGAPDLTDEAWLYGSTKQQIATSIRTGRNGIMPAHANRLTPNQIKVLTAWLTAPATNRSLIAH